MTFGEKLKVLRKEHSYSQEEFAQLLNVSRQAVSKWESNRGIPETDKLIQISTILGVTLDYLLKADQTEDAQQNNGYYVGREMIEGFLSYKRQDAKRIAIGVSLIVLSNLFTCTLGQNQFAMLLYWVTLALGISFLVWNFFQPRRYKDIGTKQLLFDDITIKEFRQEHEKNRKRYVLMIIAAIIILIVSPEVMILAFENAESSIALSLSWVLLAIELTLVILAGITLHAEQIIAHNTAYMEKQHKKNKFAWIYIAIPATAIAVAIGLFTNAWSPVMPIIILLCVLLVTFCKILLEGRNQNE